ncbi:MAG: hypothetical protein ACE14L_15265 [Terriglobales bacterium]
MKVILLLVTVITAVVPGHTQQQQLLTFDVRRPTVVAFFPPVTQAELRDDPDTNEALADFQVYAQKVRERLRDRGIDFHEVYAHRFVIRQGKKLVVFTPDKVQVGYYFVVPGKKPRIHYGVDRYRYWSAANSRRLLRVAAYARSAIAILSRPPTLTC